MSETSGTGPGAAERPMTDVDRAIAHLNSALEYTADGPVDDHIRCAIDYLADHAADPGARTEIVGEDLVGRAIRTACRYADAYAANPNRQNDHTVEEREAYIKMVEHILAVSAADPGGAAGAG